MLSASAQPATAASETEASATGPKANRGGRGRCSGCETLQFHRTSIFASNALADLSWDAGGSLAATAYAIASHKHRGFGA